MSNVADKFRTGLVRANAALTGDRDLLCCYAESRNQGAFGELVRRHIDSVYSTALRRVGGDAHSAADVTQHVFTALARQAARLGPDVVLSAWLYATTRHLTANLVRAEQSRRTREREAHAMNELNATTTADAEWERIRPVLDEVMDELDEQDRGAVLLRFFARRPFAEIGATLKVSEDAARMRVDRALEKLRIALARRGVVSIASVIGGALAQNAVGAAPAGLAAIVTGAALSSTGGLAGTIALLMATKFQVGVAAAAVCAAAAGGWMWQQRRVDGLRATTSAPHSQLTREPRLNTGLVNVQSEPGPPTTGPRAGIAALSASMNRPSGEGDGHVARSTTAGGAPGNAVQAIADRRVARLDALVYLTPEQKARVMEAFRNEAIALEAFPAGEERAEKGMDIRQASRAEVHALLTPEQRSKYNVAPQSLGGALPVDPGNFVRRLDDVVTLTSEQKQKATEVFWDDLMDQMAALPADQPLKGFLWRDKVRDRLRAVLTPEQQAKFDATPPYKKTRSADASH